MTGLLEGAPGLPGVSRADAASFIFEGVRNTLRGAAPRIPVTRFPICVDEHMRPDSGSVELCLQNGSHRIGDAAIWASISACACCLLPVHCASGAMCAALCQYIYLLLRGAFARETEPAAGCQDFQI